MKKSPRRPSSSSNTAIPLRVLYEDNHCLVVYKPAGMLTAGDKSGDVSMLDLAKQYLKDKYRKPGNVYLGLVHRLDRPVSGLLLFARTGKAAARLSQQFRVGSVRKTYLAWVEGAAALPAGTVTDLIVKDKRLNVSRTVHVEQPDAKAAVLEYRVLKRTRRETLLEVRPQTGRPHQIRVQLAAQDLPIVGDVKYGARAAQTGRLALHAAELTFEHPVRHETVSVRVPEPPDWKGTYGQK